MVAACETTRKGAVGYHHAFCWMMRPHNYFRVVWDVLASILLSYDLVLIPMNVFELPKDGFIFAMSVVSLVSLVKCQEGGFLSDSSLQHDVAQDFYEWKQLNKSKHRCWHLLALPHLCFDISNALACGHGL